jgi:hypothetical protein
MSAVRLGMVRTDLFTGKSDADASACPTAVRRSALVTNAFHIKDTLECIELTYAVSPPGPSDAQMSEIKLQFSFAGEAEGNLDVWLNRPQERRPEGSYKFGLGISAMQQGSGLHNNSGIVSFVSFVYHGSF